ncbi:nucleoside triphosphate pyrophosphohydrolase [Labedella phragmitis]|uniref:Nucleoside triphosphate pyrophosphohydrolase n=1 Tax=Labedella phragmitis TaxID=2498849 RepID=A0A444PQS5_9MICO|nr:MazG nucleotide pyrophosphohydrolase domain-containing protein [Labedella phragmitis]RWZ49617.1 nucleoside triphosphate pyrophosphohydrolase [Labedella phragmitis]
MTDLPELARLVAAMEDVLDRCVWSRTMTHESLLTYLVEESYELVDAVESGEPDHIREELADVLLQVVFHSAIAARTPSEGFGVEQVAAEAADKMIRRHPHVFAGVDAPTVEDVLRVWSAAKAEEKAARESIMDGLPSALPALALAAKTIGRIERSALGVEVPPPVVEVPGDEEALGRLLLGITAAAARSGLDPERALRRATVEMQETVRAAERSRGDRDGEPADG